MRVTYIVYIIVDFIKDRVKAVAMANSVHARDLIEGESRRAFMFNVSFIVIFL